MLHKNKKDYLTSSKFISEAYGIWGCAVYRGLTVRLFIHSSLNYVFILTTLTFCITC